jgi:hypothetical protein
MIETNFESADMTGCLIYGIAAWAVRLKDAKQTDLVVTRPGEPAFQVDDLQMAQFIYLFIDNNKIREVIATLTSKVVLILGSFSAGRKVVLDGLRGEMRRRGYLPIVFDFPPPATRTTLETVCALAHLARFVLADITDARSVLQELQALVPINPSLPVEPLILATQHEPGMFDFLKRFPWFLEAVTYHDMGTLLATLDSRVIAPVENAVSIYTVK